MTLTGSAGDFCSITHDSDIALRGMKDTNFWKFSDTCLKRENLNPGNAEWFMKQEKKCRLESDTIVFDTNSDTTVVPSEFFETDRICQVCVVGDIAAEKFLPLTPACHMVGHPTDDGPQNESPKKEHKKDFHTHSVPQVFPIAIYETTTHPKSTRETCNREFRSILGDTQKLWKKFSSW